MVFKRRKQEDNSNKNKLFGELLLMTTGGALVVLLLLLFNFWQSGLRFFDGLNTILNPSPPEPKVDVRSIVLRQVRGASELTTAVFAMEAVVPTSQDSKLGNFVVGKTKLLYIAYGEVRAGVDLAQLAAENVQIVNDTISIRLPPPQIIDSKIDVKRSFVYDYDRGLLGLGPDVAPQLQMLAEKHALSKIVAAACSENLLTEANDRAKLVVNQLMSATWYKKVVVETQPPSADACPSN